MNVVIVDGHGGSLGAQLIKELLVRFSNIRITAIGTNAIATSAMLKAGAVNAATGENPLLVACRRADVIIGPIGIVIADSLFGEVTPQMAVAVAQSEAVRILIPVNKCDNMIAGISVLNMRSLITDVIAKLENVQALSAQRNCGITDSDNSV